MVTSNRDTDELMGLFPDALLGNAAMDRLLHHAHVLRLTGRSFRSEGVPTSRTVPPRTVRWACGLGFEPVMSLLDGPSGLRAPEAPGNKGLDRLSASRSLLS